MDAAMRAGDTGLTDATPTGTCTTTTEAVEARQQRLSSMRGDAEGAANGKSVANQDIEITFF
jgi:hypothetical protein